MLVIMAPPPTALAVDNVIRGAVTCVRIIKQDAKKMIAEVQWADRRAVVKCSVPGLHERFVLVLPWRVIYTSYALIVTQMSEIFILLCSPITPKGKTSSLLSMVMGR